jgi:hypothetical protein
MDAINNIKEKITGQGDEQRAGVTNSAAVRSSSPLPLFKKSTDGQPTGPTAGAGEFPKSGDFPVESQVDRVVGIQDDMERKPEGAAVQEGHDNFDSYKPAGKVSSFSPFLLVFQLLMS